MFGINDNQNDNSQTGAKPDGSLNTDTPAEEKDLGMPPAETVQPSAGPSGSPAGGGDALMNIKEQALSSLSPLVNHLDQTPDERFKTLMMLIQASDDSSLIKEAYESANKITDEKARAQALLDVINEINYFSQKDKQT